MKNNNKNILQMSDFFPEM